MSRIPRLAVTAFLLAITAGPALAQHVPLVWDAAAAPSGYARALRATDRYRPETGFGWESDVRPFVRADVNTFREGALRDGVAGRRVAFRADVPNGRWWLTAWVEAGLEDSTTATYALAGDAMRPFPHQPFVTPSEPRVALQKLYRVLHVPVNVIDGSVRLTLEGGADTVRVLALALQPVPIARRAQHQAWRGDLNRVGRYGATEALAPLHDALKSAGERGDTYASYWAQQVSWLADAEEYIRLAGWGWATARQRAGIFDRFHQAIALLDGILYQPNAEQHPLYERALVARMRLLYWLWKEQGGGRGEERRGAARDVAALRQRYPDDPLLR
ncbi:MAG TPA: hypothetical protein VD948_12380, partial [Rhodothermales bacterium]|nr:hypothetical protein [Rhodothermales bacterium]